MTNSDRGPSTTDDGTVTAAEITSAANRVAGHAVRTPLVPAAPMSQRCGSTVVIKTEHRQRTGSFKIRGALNKTFSLGDEEARSGVVTASSGNHGIGVATAAAARDINATVYLPDGASASKVDAITRLGASIVTVDDTDTAMAEVAARKASSRSGLTYISPYNDPQIVAGQGTIGIEILEDWEGLKFGNLDAVVVAVGGGGLISGIATWIKDRSPGTRIVGASPENDQAMIASVSAGEIVEPPALPTLSDGTAGAVEAGSITHAMCTRLVDEWMTVGEADIAAAVTAMIDDHHELVEGAAGVALAAAERFGTEHPGSRIVVVSCGANISSSALATILAMGGH